MQFLICLDNLYLCPLLICETNYTLSLSTQGINLLVQKLSVNVYFYSVLIVKLRYCLQSGNCEPLPIDCSQ